MAEISARLNQVRSELPQEAESPVIEIQRTDKPYATFYISFTSTSLTMPQLNDFMVREIRASGRDVTVCAFDYGVAGAGDPGDCTDAKRDLCRTVARAVIHHEDLDRIDTVDVARDLLDHGANRWRLVERGDGDNQLHERSIYAAV